MAIGTAPRKPSTETMIVDQIIDQGDRVILYPKGYCDGYHLIARPGTASEFTVGDSVEYEPFGGNFGFVL